MANEFSLFTTSNSYITPYASGTSGEELLTEFNQRAALNALGERVVNQNALIETRDNISYEIPLSYDQGCTGAARENDLKLSISDPVAGITVSQGSCLIAGYYFELYPGVAVSFDDLFNGEEEIVNQGDATELHYDVVMLQLTLGGTSGGNSRNQRLVPTVEDWNRNIYQCLKLVFGKVSDLQTAGESAMLLGILAKNKRGDYFLWDNPLRTSLIPISKLAGYDNLRRWVSVPENAVPGAYYAIQENALSNTVDVTDFMWLKFNSTLGSYLRNLVTWPDMNGQVTSTEKPIGLIVGNRTSDDTLDVNLLKVIDDKLPKISYRVLKDYPKSNSSYQVVNLSLPMASYIGSNNAVSEHFLGTYRDSETGPTRREIQGAKSGMITGEDLYHLRTLWADKEGVTTPGREFGPFETRNEADLFIQRKGSSFFQEGDFFWIIKDTLKEAASQTSLGTVSGTARTRFEGNIPITVQDMSISGTVSGSSVENPAAKITSGTITQLSGNFTGGTLEFEKKDIQLTVLENTQVFLNVVGYGDVTSVEVDHLTFSATTADEQPLVITSDVQGSVRAGSATYTISNISGEVPRNSIVVGSVSSTLTTDGTFSTNEQSHLTFANASIENAEFEIETFKVIGEGKGDGKVSSDVTVGFTGSIDSVTQWISTLNVYTTVYDENGNSSLKWVLRGCLRGFSAPATTDIYGFVKVSDESTPGGVVLNEFNQLRLNETDTAKLDTVGWKSYSGDSQITVNRDNISTIVEDLSGTKLDYPITLKFSGSEWGGADDYPPLDRIRGDVTLDLSQVNNPTVQNDAGEQVPTTVVRPILNCTDIDRLTIKAKNSEGRQSTGKVNVSNCTLNCGDFNNIYRWDASRFSSGSNTFYPDNAWVKIPNIFNDNKGNAFVRFASFTRGEYGIIGGELDIWIEREAWQSTETAPENIMLVSHSTLKFPPLVLKLDENGKTIERQDIPEDLNLKIAGACGVNMTLNAATSSYVPTGDLVTTIDWEHEGYLSFNARLIFPTGNIHGLENVRFRAPIQVTMKPDVVSQTTDYSNIYPSNS